jgi:predicted phosphodiesterase
MTYRAIFMSDIHGNLPALQAVRGSLPAHDAVYVAGDLCFEGPCPAQVLDLLLESGWTLIMGNTDRDIVIPPESAGGLNGDRVTWTREALGADRLERLATLPFSATCAPEGADEVLVVHANPLNMDEHLPPTLSAAELAPYLHNVTSDIIVFGHLHTPYVRPVDDVLLIDVSSVGHPKDRDRRAAYTIITWDGERRSIEQVRIPYDLEQAVSLLRRSDMPGAEEQIESLLKASY